MGVPAVESQIVHLALLRSLLCEDTSRLRHIRTLEASPGTPADWPDWLHPAIVDAYRALGIDRPWLHQAEAAEAIRLGRHTVISTATGSGKSLALWLGPLNAIAQAQHADARISTHRARPTALYLAPTKALAADQLTALRRLTRSGDLGWAAIGSADGDTSREARDWARDYGNIVLSNPDFLHFALLPNHQRWARLLRGLRYVIVDEAHAYRGVFGAHVALVLRRLRRICRHYGSDPTFILASATTGDPVGSTAALVGVSSEQVGCIDRDTATHGRRTIGLWEPPLLSDDQVATPDLAESPQDMPETGPRRSATAECARLLADLTAAGARTLAFVRSRFAAEGVAQTARDLLADSPSAARVATYRGGYLPEERRELEAQLRDGRLLGLVSTNALELGIDIAGLDAVLVAGWPGTRVSMWQQFGRAGRAGADGLAIWIAGSNPLESYLLDHPEALFDEPVEATVFDPHNPYVLAPHLCAAAAELPLRPEETALFGQDLPRLAADLEAAGMLKHRDAGWYWVHAESPTRLTDLRGSGGQPVQVVLDTGEVIGSVDAARAESTLHPNAVYVHQGRYFVVDLLDLDGGVAVVRPQRPSFRTTADSATSISIARQSARESWGRVGWGFGDVEVRNRVTSYTRLRLPGLERMDTRPLDFPEHSMMTRACWWTVPLELAADAGIAAHRLPGALHAAEHAAIGLLPLLATCDRWDLGGLSTALHPDTGLATVFVHDSLPGGTGFAERGFDQRELWLRATLEVIANCGCADGCPACIQSPKCGNGNQTLDKDAARMLLTAILAELAA